MSQKEQEKSKKKGESIIMKKDRERMAFDDDGDRS